MKLLAAAFLALALPCHLVAGLSPQSDVWNSTFRLTAAQKDAAGLPNSTARNVEIALNYERTNNAGRLIQDDPFYGLPASYNHSAPPPPGTLLKVEVHTNISLYTIPMTLSMSRILYVSETLDHASVPASGFILWPYQPRRFEHLDSCSNSSSRDASVYPVIALAHGTSGPSQACAPSGQRDLWDEFHEPFAMALDGYAVVAADYQGLGVAGVPSPYFVTPTQANDVFHAVTAAQQAFPARLSRRFVVAGQSQGGATAWTAAQRQFHRPVPGYLGTVAASPFPDILADIAADRPASTITRIVGIALGLGSVLPGFDLSSWLTPIGVARARLLAEIQGCSTTATALLAPSNEPDLVIARDGWNTTAAADWLAAVSRQGGQDFAGPLLVLQGDADPRANEPVTTAAVEATCALLPRARLRYVRFANVTHSPVLYAGQHLYLDWIRERFAGRPVAEGCQMEKLHPPAGINAAEYAAWGAQNWFIEYDEFDIGG